MSKPSKIKLYTLCVFSLGLLTGSMLSGCFGSSALPSWYGKNQASSEALIGFGSGESLESAKAKAMADLITQLSVRVDSRFSTSTERYHSKTLRSSSQNVELQSRNLELKDVQYTKSTFQDERFYIQAQIPKQSLIAQFQILFSQLYDSVAQLTDKCSELSIKDQMRLIQSLESLELYASILQSLGSPTQSLQDLQALLAQNTPLPRANLLIQSNMSNEILANNLSKELGYFYSLDSQSSQSIDAKINVQTRNEKVKVEILLTLKDCRKNSIFHTSANYTHHASNIDEALQFASKRASVQIYKHIQEWIER